MDNKSLQLMHLSRLIGSLVGGELGDTWTKHLDNYSFHFFGCKWTWLLSHNHEVCRKLCASCSYQFYFFNLALCHWKRSWNITVVCSATVYGQFPPWRGIFFPLGNPAWVCFYFGLWNSWNIRICCVTTTCTSLPGLVLRMLVQTDKKFCPLFFPFLVTQSRT